MKKLFFLITILLPAMAFAQAPAPAAGSNMNFTLKGKIGSLGAPAKAYLQYFLGSNNVIDSTDVADGNFEFKGTLLNPVNANLVVDRKGLGVDKLDKNVDGINFYLEPATITMTTADSITKAKITGSVLNDENTKLQVQLTAINVKVQKLKAIADAAPAEQRKQPAYQKDMSARFKVLQTEQKTALKNFILTHHNSYLSLLALNAVGGPAPEYSEIDPLYNTLSQSLKDSESGKILKAQLAVLKVTALGAIAPDFTQNDINGAPVTLSSFRGKYVLIDFWASWCGPCLQENPNLVRNYAKYKIKNFTIIGVSLDRPEGKDAWINTIKSQGLNWTQVSDLKFWGNQAAGLYSVSSIPQNFLVDPSGKIIAKNLRGDELDAKLEELFGKI